MHNGDKFYSQINPQIESLKSLDNTAIRVSLFMNGHISTFYFCTRGRLIICDGDELVIKPSPDLYMFCISIRAHIYPLSIIYDKRLDWLSETLTNQYPDT